MDSRIGDEIYRQIKEYALSRTAKSKNLRHDDKHALRVKENALKIIRLRDN